VAGQLMFGAWNMAEARAAASSIRAGSAPDDPIGLIRHDLDLARAEYRYREAIRDEQAITYRLASDPVVSDTVIRLLPADQAPALGHAVDALRALWAHAGIPENTQVRVRRDHKLAAPAGVSDLAVFYRQAAARYGLDWTYLAAINYIESDFGRVNGPSSAGALGPMQFLPSTWREVGEGDVMDPHDSIFAAARYLARNGAPDNMRRALFRYNNDFDYVDAVAAFAAAVRADALWLERLFYWSTQG
jgi:soluble lytic murein transglycosylase-like protein